MYFKPIIAAPSKRVFFLFYLAGKGNVVPSAEFNFYFDPEAAYVVLNELCCPITIVPWETCLAHPLSWVSDTVIQH